VQRLQSQDVDAEQRGIGSFGNWSENNSLDISSQRASNSWNATRYGHDLGFQLHPIAALKMHLVLMLIRLSCIVGVDRMKDEAGSARGALFNRSANRPPFDDIHDRRSTMSSDEASRTVSGVEWRGSGPNHADAELIALGREFEALSAKLAELVVLQRQEVDALNRMVERDERLNSEGMISPSVERIEALLRLLEPIERAIMAIPAMTVVGLGVKARHAAHVLSHYWTESPDRLDWDAQAVRRLIESTCTVAGVALLSSQR
jgi:hypothetical protein